MSTTYNERVRSIAEEFAKLSYTHFHKASPDVQEHWILSMYPLAEIAVRLMGEAFDNGFGVGCSATNILTEEEDILEYAYSRKHDLGLIKPTNDALELPETA